jgi:uncharacterized protein YwqG
VVVTRANLSKALRRLGLARYEAALSASARPAIRMRTVRCNDDDVPLGGSKLGGKPDLPAGVAWPHWEGRPLNFIAQLDCSELQRFESAALLPPDGLLSFFYDAEEQPWGHDSADAGAARVLHHAANGGLERRAKPRASFRANRLELHEILTFPTEAGFDVEPEEIGRLSVLFDPGVSHREHQLLGYPSVIQNPMELQCQLASHGVYVGEGYPADAVARWGAGAAAWRLLLQVDSIGDMMWGDMGMIYFWITEDALRAREFDRAWLALQC